jgi:transcriptional regulator with XRE-family HTH domain
VRQRRLRVELRRARDEAAFTQEQVAENLDWSLSKVIRIESGAVNISTTDLKAILSLYGIDSDRIEELVQLAKAARERTWWSGYRRVLPPQYYDLIGYESAAHIIRQYENLIMPGLLQTQEYAQEYIASDLPPDKAADLDALVEVRMRRQDILDGEGAPTLFFVLDESVVRRQIGGARVMRDQLRHLVELANRPNITIEVVPFSAGANPGRSFTILEFSSAEDDDVLHLESPGFMRVTRDLQDAVVTYRERFERLREVSLRPEGSAVLLTQLADSL